jgi:uncharacterized protein DUF5995
MRPLEKLATERTAGNLAAALPAADGLACFNRMYLDVTTQVNSQLGQGFFADPVFMTNLDVAFANLYFARPIPRRTRRRCRWPGGRLDRAGRPDVAGSAMRPSRF